MIMDTKYRREKFLEGRSESSNAEQDEKNWKKLWKVKVPSKLKVFAWRLAKSSLPTGEVRERRHMATSALCPVCNVSTDTWRHSLLDCNMARPVWALKDDDVTLPLFADETPDPKLWLFSLSQVLSQEKYIEVLVTLWAIWWARRKLIHEDEFQSSLSTHGFITRYLADLCYLHNKEERSSNTSLTIKKRWLLPPAGTTKINVDGAVAKTENRGAVSAVCRDDTGTFVGASAITVEGITDPEVLEAVACAEALSLASDLQLARVYVSSDCLNIIKEINGGPRRGLHCMIVKEVLFRKEQFQEVIFTHDSRETNDEAHRLARVATTLESGRHVWSVNSPSRVGIPVNAITSDE